MEPIVPDKDDLVTESSFGRCPVCKRYRTECTHTTNFINNWNWMQPYLQHGCEFLESKFQIHYRTSTEQEDVEQGIDLVGADGTTAAARMLKKKQWFKNGDLVLGKSELLKILKGYVDIYLMCTIRVKDKGRKEDILYGGLFDMDVWRWQMRIEGGDPSLHPDCYVRMSNEKPLICFHMPRMAKRRGGQGLIITTMQDHYQPQLPL